ncbi:MAG: murein biosynthesis integral membrane protein MurJ [Alphaproteobacteria bacterium]|nr:murein biosynthesis integral membrane protein MurJ [Alphaproteobacteria bacterium]
MSLLRPIATVGGYTILSRITGFSRDMMIANALGAGILADVFFVAFKLPNLFRRLFAEGAFSAAFVPLYAGTVATDGREAAQDFANRSFSALLVVLIGFVAFMEIIMPWAIYAFAPGFEATPGKIELAAELTRLTFPFLLFISLVSLQGGVLNSLGHFAAAAGTPVLLNLTMMASLVMLAPLTHSPAHALAWGTSLSGVVQFAWLWASCWRVGAPLRLVRPRYDAQVRLLVRRILPVAFGAGLYQVSLLIDTMLASLLAPGAVSYLYYADRVNQLPLGVIGIAVGTALLPLLSRRLHAGDADGAMASQNRALEFALLLTVPAAIALAICAQPIVSVLFERGAFGPAETHATAAALAAFSLGLPAFVMAKVFTPGFFARNDTRTPVKIAAWALLANVIMNLLLMVPLRHVGIALATASSSWINAIALGVVLYRRGQFHFDPRLRKRLPRLFASSLGLGLLLVGGQWELEGYFAGSFLARTTALAGLVAGGMGAFGILAYLTGTVRPSDLRSLWSRG